MTAALIFLLLLLGLKEGAGTGVKQTKKNNHRTLSFPLSTSFCFPRKQKIYGLSQKKAVHLSFLSVTPKGSELRSTFSSCCGEVLFMVSSYDEKSDLQEPRPYSGELSNIQDDTWASSLGWDYGVSSLATANSLNTTFCSNMAPEPAVV